MKTARNKIFYNTIILPDTLYQKAPFVIPPGNVSFILPLPQGFAKCIMGCA